MTPLKERMTKLPPSIDRVGKIKFDGSIDSARAVGKFCQEVAGTTTPLARISRGDTLYVYKDRSYYVARPRKTVRR